MKHQRLLVKILFITFLLVACKTKSNKEIHPYLERIPEIDNEHILVSKSNEEDASLGSTQLLFLEQILKNNKEMFGKVELSDLTLGDGIKIVSVNKDRFLILDKNEDRLIEYNLRLKEKVVLAERGHGPGDLFLSSDIDLFKKSLHISNKDGRISNYDCNQFPCEYLGSVSVEEIVPYSLFYNLNGLVFLGSRKLPPQRQPLSDTKIENTSMWVYDDDDVLKNSFGKHYDVGEHWMLQNSFNEGIVEYAEGSKNYFSAFHRLPIIYVYDESYNLIETFKISDFILGEQEYDTKTGRLSVVLNGFSTIEEMKYISDNKILVVVKTLTNRRTLIKDMSGIRYSITMHWIHRILILHLLDLILLIAITI